MQAYKQKVERPDLTVITLCPGWVQTGAFLMLVLCFAALLRHVADMGGAGAALTPEESVTGIIKVITNATKADSGKYLRQTGEEIPW